MGVPLRPKVAVIGAGWSGLAAAVGLLDAGVDVTVFEASRQPGGRARSVEWNGQQVDNGQHLLVGAYTSSLDLMRRVGVDIDKALLRTPLQVEVPGRMSMRLPRLPAPFHLAAGLLGARGVSPREKISAARFMRQLQKAEYRLPSDIPVAEWLDQHHQRGSLRTHLWESLCLAALNTRPGEASAQIFANVLRDTLGGSRAATDMLLPGIDLGKIFPEHAVRYIVSRQGKVEFGARVSAVYPSTIRASANAAPQWEIAARDQRHRFDQIIIAVAPQHALALLPDHPGLSSLRASLSRFCWEPIATAYLQYPADIRLSRPLIAINQGMAQWLADRGQLGGAPGLLAHVLSAHGDWENLDNPDLASTLHQDTNTILRQHGNSAPLPPFLASLIIREHRATFSCRPGLERPPNATALQGLWLAGDYVASDYPGTLEAAVRSGEKTAQSLIAEMKNRNALKAEATDRRPTLPV